MFLEKVETVTQAMQDMGNPYQEECRDLLSLDAKDIGHQTAAEPIGTHLEKGKVPASKPKVLQEGFQIFSNLFISCQSRECDLKEYFHHVNQSYPAALSDGGKLYTWEKSHFTTIFESQITTPEAEPDADIIIIDGAALMNSLPPRSTKIFEEYTMLNVLPIIQYPSVADDENLEASETFGVMMYDRSSTAEDVDDAKLDMFAIRSYSSNLSSGEVACEACFLQGGPHLESVNITSTRNADSWQLELNQERKSVADRLDRAPIICGELPAADQV
ncbi:unnamed protein product [Acanthosepion pharaonis]|uniref:Uncharacterized protein n=1 Tax=Acanthosepion pharaonis TaxID=158019 RepID=A0A812DJ37_ACAPH|nr:unnamed protein product [Sepia pharaonis]